MQSNNRFKPKAACDKAEASSAKNAHKDKANYPTKRLRTASDTEGVREAESRKEEERTPHPEVPKGPQPQPPAKLPIRSDTVT